MIKPDYCTYCGCNTLLFIKDNSVFNPDTDIDEIMDSYVCTECKTIHVNNRDFKFIQKEIDINKATQYTNKPIIIINK